MPHGDRCIWCGQDKYTDKCHCEHKTLRELMVKKELLIKEIDQIDRKLRKLCK